MLGNDRETINETKAVARQRPTKYNREWCFLLGPLSNTETVFPLRFVPSLNNEKQLRLRESLLERVQWRRVGGWCEMAASMRVRTVG
jgi:hypothetical protein